MAKVTCEYCQKSVGVAYLPKHQKTGACLEKQGKHATVTYPCEWCGEEFLRSNTMTKHLARCKQRVKVLYTSTEDRLRQDVRELTSGLAKAESENKYLEERIEELELAITLRDKEIAVLKANPTVVNQVTNNNFKIKVDKFVVNQHAKEHFRPMTDGLLREVLSMTPDPRFLLGGAEAIAELLLNTCLEGNDKLACTDVNRIATQWKDIDHSIVSDPRLRKLLPRMIRHFYASYYRAYRDCESLSQDEFFAIGDNLKKLNSIMLKKDSTSKFYNTIASRIGSAKCDLTHMLDMEEMEIDYGHDDDGNSIEYMLTDSDM